MRRMRRVSVTGTAASVVLASLIALPVSPVSAAPKITFHVTIGSSCLDGTAPAGKRVHIVLKTPGGQLRGTDDETVRSDGTFNACPAGDLITGLFGGLNGGDVITARVGTLVRTWTVPRVTAQIDRASDVVSGRAPAGTHVTVSIAEIAPSAPLSASPTAGPNDLTVVANAKGEYRADFAGAVNIVGGDPVMVAAAFGADGVAITAITPYLLVTAGSNILYGSAGSDLPVDFALRTAGGTLRAQAHTQSLLLGIFIARLVDPSGSAVYPRRGDWLTASFASDAFLKIPDWKLAGDKKTEMVTGRCMPRSAYAVQIYGRGSDGYTTSAGKGGTTAADGSFRWNLLGLWNVKAGDSLILSCMYRTGDQFAVSSDVH